MVGTNLLNPREVNNNFTEGNAWQYTFFVPHDIPGMIQAYGGNDKFEAKLDEMFNAESKTTGREQVDVTGLIGQYAHGNEPSHHMAYLYNYIGKPEKTNEKVNYILDNFYTISPDGLIGNEDCGQMSAWYILSSMGIYSVTPGQLGYSKTTPYFEKVKVNFENKEQLSITKKGMNGYSKEVTAPTKISDFGKIIQVPVIQAESKSFKDKLKIEIISQNPNDEIYYIFNSASPGKPAWMKYSGPIEISQSKKISAYVKHNDEFSSSVSAQFFKKPNNYTINIKSEYNPQYHAGGADALLDGINGNENWRKGEWQGYQGQDFECVIDLKTAREISSVNSNYSARHACLDCNANKSCLLIFPKTISILQMLEQFKTQSIQKNMKRL